MLNKGRDVRNSALCAVAPLGDRAPAAAEDLAHWQQSPDFLSDTRVLGVVIQAGIDTGHWKERRAGIRVYAREADWLSTDG
ncbi:hypothetical protein AB0I51_40710 [Streptomyces sp. NPDC050549]|uniref:hypothetical protein n=1 Tax=Streptomyces sp. NPDC050549 TaxID=3155406 RepID=UPI00342F5EFF